MSGMRRIEGPAEKPDDHAALCMRHGEVTPVDPYFGYQISGPCLAGAMHAVLERGKLFDTDRSPRVHLARRDADFCPHAEFATISELCRRIMQENGGIDFVEEALDD